MNKDTVIRSSIFVLNLTTSATIKSNSQSERPGAFIARNLVVFQSR